MVKVIAIGQVYNGKPVCHKPCTQCYTCQSWVRYCVAGQKSLVPVFCNKSNCTHYKRKFN